MKNDYLLPGIAAIVLAILFPTAVFSELFNIYRGDWEGGAVDTDNWFFNYAVSLAIGFLCIYVIFNLKKVLNEQLNYKSVDVPLLILIGISVIFHILLVVFEGALDSMDLASSNPLDNIVSGVTIACFIVFGATDLVIGIILLTKGNELPSILKVLAVISIIQGISELSVILFFLVILTFPIYMITLAIYFLRKPETIEVV